MPTGKGSIDHQVTRPAIRSFDSVFPERVMDGVRSKREFNDHVDFRFTQGLFSRVGEFRIGKKSERCTFGARWDWRCAEDHRARGIFRQEPHKFQGDVAAERVAEYGETIEAKCFNHFTDGTGVSVEIVRAQRINGVGGLTMAR